MATPTLIAGYILLFALVGGLFLFANMVVGWLLRPRLPNREKLEVYECGEPAIGSSFVQFDLRFYVVALLFIIFDVEVAFFFPWATVFGKSTELAAPTMAITAIDAGELDAPPTQLSPVAKQKLRELGIQNPTSPTLSVAEAEQLDIADAANQQTTVATRRLASKLAWTSLADIGVFFAVLMVGFAYVWRRGDLDWVRAVEKTTSDHRPAAPPAFARSA
jgi:NADH-quinone oxidoreductase subunit A